ncbi:blue (type 1) copper domain-containing protein [Halosimplex carlsbadense 2-9-1]|uniref:Blue (Type 1) copper domain-containing protein n=1 Tax=Halosimplex carlsbadense 2-9-1 TaxID=797114 RepID=M0D0B7_9EURY|nr:plastocyanin/azurin family copper-binding protein [Halosimplex carlsbadense]ELZ28112.1 blue (type 1) copper domain-containing protein [Halosimplex carlsbadense 2-9-1]
MKPFSRRALLRASGLAAAGAVAGCATDDSDGPTGTPNSGDIVAGPNGAYAYDPEEYTVSVGETVTWYFASPTHNVGCRPGDSPQISLPDGAESFASYDDGNVGQTVPQGETYEHTFETAGEYTYVCIPHSRQGMVGTVVVEE